MRNVREAAVEQARVWLKTVWFQLLDVQLLVKQAVCNELYRTRTTGMQLLGEHFLWSTLLGKQRLSGSTANNRP